MNFTHRALENHWFPKSLRFSPPGSHPVFKRIMKRIIANCKVIDRENFRHRGTLESWHTAIIINADNAKHLPEQYTFLLQYLLSYTFVVVYRCTENVLNLLSLEFLLL